MPHAELLEDKIVVQTHWNEAELVKTIPGARWDRERRVWTLPVSWAACVQLRGTFGAGLTIGDGVRAWARHEVVERVEPAKNLREQTDVDSRFFDDSRLYPFQAAGVRFLYVAGSALLADEMGTGKTIQALLAIKSQTPALVICPNGVKNNWANECRVWRPDLTPYVVQGSAAVRLKILKQAADDPEALVVVNYEALRAHSRLAGYGSQALRRCLACGGRDADLPRSRCEVHARELNEIGFETVIVDEAHRIKAPNAKQTRAAWAIGHQPGVDTRIALTGTPIANDPSDLWSIMHFIDPLEYPRRTAFVDRYCLLAWGTYGGMEVKGIRPDRRDEFYKILDPRFRRMLKAIVSPQLPPKIRVRRDVDLSPRQLKAYRDIETGLVTRLPDGSVMVARDNLVAQTRLLQFASATMRAGDGGFEMCDPSSKIDQLVEDLEDLGDAQVAVCAQHRQLINLAAARLRKLGISHTLFTGGQQPWEREAGLAEFQAGKTRVMLFTLAAGGTGTTMTAASTLIRLQRSWSMIDNRQGEDRVHRIGSERHDAITIIDYVAGGTIEEDQVGRLWEKSERLEEINRDRARLKAAGLPTDPLDAEEATLLGDYLGESERKESGTD